MSQISSSFPSYYDEWDDSTNATEYYDIDDHDDVDNDEYYDEYNEPEDHDNEWIDMSGIPEDATFEEPELACMLESLQKGKRDRARVSGKARKAVARVSGTRRGSSLKPVDTDEEMRTGESDVKKPRVELGALCVKLAVCEDGYDRSFDPAWDPIPERSARFDAK